MPLSPSDNLGPYEILCPIGKGGMGEVYRARDPRLNREVAIKTSAERFGERFEREARAIAALNHPNICTLYDVGPDYLVMELVEGETLAERIQAGSLPLEEALGLAQQIAEALEAAHEKGIVHRDLKPTNIKITPEGTVKVLDFGLAKIAEAAKQPDSDPEHSPTLTLEAATQVGTVMGTAGYMAPEQAKGKRVDKRADIWAFGVVLFEMVTGKRLFQGVDVTEILASVVKEQPDLSVAPPRVRRLLSRCLEKDPKKRLRDISVAWELLEEPGVVAEVARSPSRLGWLPWALVGVLVMTVAVLTFLRPRSPAPERVSARFAIDPPGDTHFTDPLSATAISPDGRYVVFGAGQGSSRLWLRPLDSLTARPLEGTEHANFPFWSPDGKSVAFYQDGELKRSDIGGGVPMVLCDAEYSRGAGGSWNRDGTILFASAGGLFQVASSGGVPSRVTELDAARKESVHGPPQFLPDGKHFLYFIASSDLSVQGIYAASLDNPKERVRVLGTNRKAYYVPPRDGYPGHLLWLREGTLLAQPFDAGKMSLEGEPVRVVEDVAVSLTLPPRSSFWTSDSGLLAYRTGDIGAKRKLVWMSRDGKALGEARKEDRYYAFRISPDGKRVAVALDEGGNRNIWVLEFGRGVMTRLTFDPAMEDDPVWSPDGSQIAYLSDRSSIRPIYRTAAGGGGREEQLTYGPNGGAPYDWSRDGSYLLFNNHDPKTGWWGLWALPLDGKREPMVVLQTPFAQYGAQFSPDGKWIAYTSNSSGSSEVYVRAFPPAPGSPWQVSNKGGEWPRWRADGKELYYVGRNGDAIMAAGVGVVGAGFESEAPRELFRVAVALGFSFPYDVAANGQRFLVFQPSAETQGPSPLTVITNWQAGLKK